MIPLSLSLQGFLSYRSTVHIDFSTFDLACISGQNGAGKSSLLDAVTWALFGIARKRDESLVNAQSSSAEVIFIFSYEDTIYRIQRTLPRGKTSLLEFQILQNREAIFENRDPATSLPVQLQTQAVWKALTERTLRDTQARIEETLRLDYDTFVNASFFLQGKADQFTQQRPTDRKRILGSILGLEVWEDYRERAAEQRKAREADTAAIDGRLGEINAELNEEAARKERLKTLQAELNRLSKSRATQEAALETTRKIAAGLTEQRKLVDALARSLETSRRRLDEQQGKISTRRKEREQFAGIVAQAEGIEQAYKAWQQAREDVSYWDEVAARFREQEKQRQGPLNEINAARARLVQEQTTLQVQAGSVHDRQDELNSLLIQMEARRLDLAVVDGKLARRTGLDTRLQEARQQQADARAENPRLKASMDDLKARIDQLSAVDGATCPLCGQPLSQSDRHRLVDDLNQQGKDMGDRFRSNQTLLREADEIVREMEEQIRALSKSETERMSLAEQISRFSARHETAQKVVEEWEQQGAPRLVEITTTLEAETYASEARLRLSAIDAELTGIGYDVGTHEAARKAEASGRQAETRLRELERARAALAPLEREIGELEKQIEVLQSETEGQTHEYDQAAAAFAAAEAQAPDLHAAERDLLAAREQENVLRLEVGAAQQKVAVLEDLKTRRKALEADRETLARLIGQYRQLEKAFGKDGVPALLIEQALPQIENKANEILQRLSDGHMSVQFVTQAQYKDKRREDLKETLDIQIRDGSGLRDYEMYSGGEAFRVNFAIRLALSEVLAQRAGARLQTLVIDEGFGSQDTQGRQRLVEAINLVRKDFARILVITHIDELKDVFPTRIEVEKTPDGSLVKVI
jgi:exonuclease SbcC